MIKYQKGLKEINDKLADDPDNEYLKGQRDLLEGYVKEEEENVKTREKELQHANSSSEEIRMKGDSDDRGDSIFHEEEKLPASMNAEVGEGEVQGRLENFILSSSLPQSKHEAETDVNTDVEKLRGQKKSVANATGRLTEDDDKSDE